MQIAANNSIYFQKNLHWRVNDVDTFLWAWLTGVDLFVG